MTTKSDQRKHPRHAALYDAKYTIDSETYKDSASNVSAGGIYICSDRNIEQGQRISVQFPIFAFDQRPRVQGMIVRSDASGFAVMFDHPVKERIHDRPTPD